MACRVCDRGLPSTLGETVLASMSVIVCDRGLPRAPRLPIRLTESIAKLVRLQNRIDDWIALDELVTLCSGRCHELPSLCEVMLIRMGRRGHLGRVGDRLTSMVDKSVPVTT